jgi:hypothetical protein
MERQHAEGRGRRDRGTRGLSACPGRAFPGHAAGADLPGFLHETSIVIRQLRCRKLPPNTSYPMLPWTAAVNQALRLGSVYERPLPSRSVGPQ